MGFCTANVAVAAMLEPAVAGFDCELDEYWEGGTSIPGEPLALKTAGAEYPEL